MVRKLKYHESKLLRKHDFVNYKQDNDHRDHDVVRRYMIQKPEDYHKYNKICGVCWALFFRGGVLLTLLQSLRQLAHRLSVG